MTLFKAISELCDVISHIVFCTEDGTLMLSMENNTNEFWIPSTKVQPGNSWQTELSKVTVDVSTHLHLCILI